MIGLLFRRLIRLDGEVDRAEAVVETTDLSAFFDSSRRIAVEVKGASAPVSEVIRGLFQCVKYEAVLDAQARVAGSQQDCEAVLALRGSFPNELTPLRHTLGVKVFENLG